MNLLVKREKEARELINSQMEKIKVIAGSKDKASKYSSAILSIAMNKSLLSCEVSSIIKTAVEIVELGLNPNPKLGLAYVVPYKNIAQLQIGYKGWITLAYRAGWVFRAVAVYDVDKFSMEFNGLSDLIEFIPNDDKRDENDSSWVFKHLKGVIVYAKDNKYNNHFTEFVSFKKLEKLRLKSPNQKKGILSNVWDEWAEEMYKSKALKYVITRLPVTDDILEAHAKEEKEYSDEILTTIIDEKSENTDVNSLLTQKEDELELQAEEERHKSFN